MTPFIEKIAARAACAPKRIAFPEGENLDILRTAQLTVEQGIGWPVLLGSPERIEPLAREHGISTEKFTYFDCTSERELRQLAGEYCAAFSDFSEKAVLRKAKDPLRCGLFLLKLRRVDCLAAGKDYATGDVVFNAIGIIGLRPGVEAPSSIGLADIPGFEGGENGMLALADCAITVEPDARDLAGIAAASADTVRRLLGWEPRIAVLGFSTCGSAEHASLEVIRQSVVMARELCPGIKIDGEFQLDAAILPWAARKKVTRPSDVAGRANVLVFPNLHAGNIGVKLIQIFGKANAYGPILQGFAQPVCDFSRSAPVDEMLGNVAMLAVRAGDGGAEL